MNFWRLAVALSQGSDLTALAEFNFRKYTMTQVQNLRPSRPGEFMCETRTADQRVQRCITTRPQDASRMERGGATVWIGRHGGWVRKG